MTITITRKDDLAQEPTTCTEDQLTTKLAEVVGRDTAGTRLAIAELARKVNAGECYKVESEFLGVHVDIGAEG